MGLKHPLYTLLLKGEVGSQVSCGQDLGSDPNSASCLNLQHPSISQMVQQHLLSLARKEHRLLVKYSC